MSLVVLQWSAVLLMVAAVLRIAWIDLMVMRIPDHWNIILGGLGLIYRYPFGGAEVVRSMATGTVAMAALALLRWTHCRMSGRIGLGLGDVKFVGGAAIWLSPWNLPLFFLLASSTALLFSLIQTRGGAANLRNVRIPFGPFLGAALVITWLLEATSVFSLVPENPL